jgi:hypothetical protein
MNSDPKHPGEKHVRIPDAWYNANNEGDGAYFLIVPTHWGENDESHDVGQFIPTKILIGAHESDATEAPTSTVATVRGYLLGENESHADNYELELNRLHDLRFRAIHSSTDGRRIKIIGA